jgi:3-methyladenine DNA glycosylase AlkD
MADNETGNPPNGAEALRVLYAQARASLTDDDLRRLSKPDTSTDVSFEELVAELERMAQLSAENRTRG